MTVRTRLGLLGVLAGLATLPGCGSESDDLAELAEMLARRGTGPMESVQVRVGELPADVRELLAIPPDIHVLGSAEASSSTRIHATTSLPPDSATMLLARELVARGWEFGAGGTLCHPEGWFIRATMDPASEAPRVLLMDAGTATGPPCGPGPMSTDRLRVDRLLPHPAPPTVRGDTELGCRGVTVTGRTVPFTGALAADSLLARYGRQMEAGGWEEIDEPTPSEAETWERDDGDGGRLSFTLAATGAPGNPSCLTLTSVWSWEW